MTLAAQVSLLATAIGAKIKIAAPITKHKVEPFGNLPQSSTAVQISAPATSAFFGIQTFNNDGAVVNGSSMWSLSGHWSGTYSFMLYYIKSSNIGIVKVEISKDGGTTWTTLTSTLDCYSATTAPASFTAIGIVIPEGSDLLFRITTVGKNASATGYYYSISGWEMLRTGS